MWPCISAYILPKEFETFDERSSACKNTTVTMFHSLLAHIYIVYYMKFTSPDGPYMCGVEINWDMNLILNLRLKTVEKARCSYASFFWELNQLCAQPKLKQLSLVLRVMKHHHQKLVTISFTCISCMHVESNRHEHRCIANCWSCIETICLQFAVILTLNSQPMVDKVNINSATHIYFKLHVNKQHASGPHQHMVD